MIQQRVIGLFVQEDTVLVMWRYRKGNEYRVFVGGSVEPGESIETALRREMLEEVNFEIESFEKLFEFENPYTDHRVTEPRLEHYYKITKWSGEIKLGNPELSIQSQDNVYRPEWVKIEELMSMNNLNPQSIVEKVVNALL